MNNRVIEFVKKHPYGTATGVAGIILVYLYLHASNQGSSAGAGEDQAYLDAQAASVQAGSAAQVAQIQANQAAVQSNNEAAVANNQVSAQEIIAALQSQDTLAGISAQAATQQNADTLAAQTTQAVSLLQAQVAENQTAAATAQTQINANAYVNIADAPYSAQEAIAADQTQVALAQVAAENAQLSTGIDYQGEVASILGWANAHPNGPQGPEVNAIVQDFSQGVSYATGSPVPIAPTPAPHPIQQITG